MLFVKTSKICSFGSLAAVFLFTILLSSQLFVSVLMPRWYGKPDVRVNGFVDTRFRDISNTFRENFIGGFERDGSHLSVYYKGHLVVDLWAGMADPRKDKLWTRNTQTVIFSITKSISALCVALLIDRGQLMWDDHVSKYWKEYGQNGKENTTVEHILSHQSGLPYIDEKIEITDVINKSSLLAKLAKAKAIWKPGTATGYHMLTQGWLIDGLIQAVDPKRRSLEKFFEEEIARPNGLDISIGLKATEVANKLSFLSLPDPWEMARDILMDPRIILMYMLYGIQPQSWTLHRSLENPSWIRIDTELISVNDPAISALPLGSIMGIANSKDLAKLFSLMLEGNLFEKNTTLPSLTTPTIENWHLEQTVLYPLMKGRGFLYEHHPYEPKKYVFGHPGFGCQSLHLDPENQLSVVYLTNGLKSATSLLCHPLQRIMGRLYKSIYQ